MLILIIYLWCHFKYLSHVTKRAKRDGLDLNETPLFCPSNSVFGPIKNKVLDVKPLVPLLAQVCQKLNQ